jgi:hypothetical protein
MLLTQSIENFSLKSYKLGGLAYNGWIKNLLETGQQSILINGK